MPASKGYIAFKVTPQTAYAVYQVIVAMNPDVDQVVYTLGWARQLERLGCGWIYTKDGKITGYDRTSLKREDDDYVDTVNAPYEVTIDGVTHFITPNRFRLLKEEFPELTSIL